MALSFLVTLLIGTLISVVGYMLMPKPKQPKPPSIDDLQEPTAEAGRAIPLVRGSMNVKGLNILWYGDKGINHRTSSSGGKK